MFKIGGRVEVIKNHSQGVVKKGEKYYIKDIIELSCGHGIAVDLGIRDIERCITKCTSCKNKFYSGKTFWINTKILRPIDEDFAEQTLGRILKEVKEEELQETINYKVNILFNKPVKSIKI